MNMETTDDNQTDTVAGAKLDVSAQANTHLSVPAVTEDMLAKLQLDGSLYSLTPEESAFFKQQTGIQGDEELKRHVLEVQKEAWDVRRPPLSIANVMCPD